MRQDCQKYALLHVGGDMVHNDESSLVYTTMQVRHFVSSALRMHVLYLTNIATDRVNTGRYRCQHITRPYLSVVGFTFRNHHERYPLCWLFSEGPQRTCYENRVVVCGWTQR